MGESGTNAHYAAEAQVQGGLPEDGEARSRGVGRIKGGNAWKSPLAESGSSWCSFGDACYAYGSASLFPVGTQKDLRLVSTPGIGARAQQTVRFCLTDTVDSVFPSFRCSRGTPRQMRSSRMCGISGQAFILAVSRLPSSHLSFVLLSLSIPPRVLSCLVCTHVTFFKPSGEKVGVLFRHISLK